MGDYIILMVESAFIRYVLNYDVRQFHRTLWNDELEIMWQEGSHFTPLYQYLALRKQKKRKISSEGYLVSSSRFESENFWITKKQ